MQSSDDAIIGLSPDGLITSWNPGAEGLYGHAADEVSGGSVSVIVPEDREEEMAGLLETVKRGERVEQYETVRLHRDGRRIHVSMTASPIRSGPGPQKSRPSQTSDPKAGGGAVTGVAIIERDISEKKRVAAEVRRAVQEAERANRAKNEFLANVSHELRTPMNAIIGMTELSLDEELSEPVRDYLDTAKDSAEVLLRLLNDILDFSRIEAGRFELDEAKFNLRDTLEETAKVFAVKAHQKELELSLRMPPTVPDRLIGDPVRLRQVLGNLLGNAVKFTERGEVQLRVETHGLRENEVELHFLVQDTGIGIGDEDQERIFAPFAQVDATSTRHHGGAGLGLAICRELVDMMGGRLWVESAYGEGTTFHFTSKFGLQPSLEGHTPAHVRELKGLPVLVVDDNATNRKILEETLKNWHMEPMTVPNAQLALEELRAAAERDSAFPLVIVDGLMPGTDGFTLVEQIRQDQHLSGATVLMLSSGDRRLFRDRCERLEIAAYLEKPVTQSELLDSIVTALQGPPLEKEAAETPGRIGGTDEPLHVLLVEDTPANRKVVTAVLTKRGHSVTVATDGREAVDLYKQRRAFDIVLMDVQMPNMDGFQATGIIRSIEQSRGTRTPIVAMTAHAMRGDRERCLAAGMDSYISKPIDVRRMIKLIERIARRHRRQFQTTGGDTTVVPQHFRDEPDRFQDEPDDAPDLDDDGDFTAAEDHTGVNTGDRAPAPPSLAPPVSEVEPAESPPPQPLAPAPNAGESGTKEPNVGKSDAEIFDRASALERLGGDDQLFRELAAYFLEDAGSELQKIDAGLAAADWAAVRIAAHSLKGLSANFSGKDATEAARDLEQRVFEQKSTAGLEPLAARLRREIDRLCAALARSGG